MRDDLISRKALLKQFIVSDSGRRIPEYDIDNFPITLSIKDVKDIIRKAPTVFDKEKVIEKLKRLEKDTFDYYNRYNDEMASGESAAFRSAIEIVEKGGIE